MKKIYKTLIRDQWAFSSPISGRWKQIYFLYRMSTKAFWLPQDNWAKLNWMGKLEACRKKNFMSRMGKCKKYFDYDFSKKENFKFIFEIFSQNLT